MEKYRIEIIKSAEKSLAKIPEASMIKIVAAIQSLARDPLPSGVKKLSGEQNTYRIRVGNYRIIYEIHHKIILIQVLKIGDRKEVYR